MIVADVLKSEEQTARVNKANFSRASLRFENVNQVSQLRKRVTEASRWIREASRATVRPEVKPAVDAAIAVAQRLVDLGSDEQKRLADAEERAETSAAIVRESRLRRLDAEEAWREGSPRADEAVRLYLSHIAAEAETTYYERQHEKLLLELRHGTGDAANAFLFGTTEGERVAQALLDAFENVGGPSAVSNARACGDQVKTLSDLGFAAVSLAGIVASHRFLEDRPTEDFVELVEVFEEAAVRRLSK